jgi:adenylosuccinate lyase
MLGKTHGQAALPTTFGKELAVYTSRLSEDVKTLSNFVLHGKLNGNVGNFNAHTFVFPKVNWIAFSKSFVSSRT